MSLLDHLAELRVRILRSLAVVLVGSIVAFVLFEPIFHWLADPFCSLPLDVRQTLSEQECFTAKGIDGAFTFRLRTSLLVGLVAASPFWLYQLWAFLAPALHRRERRWSYAFAAVGGPLFLVGAWIAYLVLEKAFVFLLGFTPGVATNMVDLNEYITWVTALTMIFGVSFEAPLLIVMLNAVDVLRASTLVRGRRVTYVLLSLYAAVVTPGQDLVSALALFVPLVFLFELSVLWCKVADRRRGVANQPA